LINLRAPAKQKGVLTGEEGLQSSTGTGQSERRIRRLRLSKEKKNPQARKVESEQFQKKGGNFDNMDGHRPEKGEPPKKWPANKRIKRVKEKKLSPPAACLQEGRVEGQETRKTHHRRRSGRSEQPGRLSTIWGSKTHDFAS